MTVIALQLLGAGVFGPGLAGWTASQAMLAGQAERIERATAIPLPTRLAAAERRRASAAIKLALAVADDACTQAGIDPSTLASVFTTSNGDGANCHGLCETLATPQPMVSPTRFTNSVHNATAGFWHIAVGSRAASTSLCMHDASFAAGLVEAALQVHATGRPVLLVASDVPYPDPLSRVRPMQDSFGAAFVLAPGAGGGGGSGAKALSVGLETGAAGATPSREQALEGLRANVPAARALPLLQALAAGRSERIVFDYRPGLALIAEFRA